MEIKISNITQRIAKIQSNYSEAQVIRNNNLKDFDLAYAYEAMARAYSIANNQNESKEWYKKAKVAGDLIVGEKDKEYFLLDLNSK